MYIGIQNVTDISDKNKKQIYVTDVKCTTKIMKIIWTLNNLKYIGTQVRPKIIVF